MPGEEIGLRNQLRARWRAQPQERRWAIVIGLQIRVAIGLWLLDHALSEGFLLICGLLWLRRIEPWPRRAAAQGGLLVLLLVLRLTGNGSWGLVVALAIVFALFSLPHSYRRGLFPPVAPAHGRRSPVLLRRY